MSAALALVELVEAGATIGADDSGLFIDAPDGLPPATLARARAARPALLLVASEVWRDELAGWGPELADLWQERAAIREHDGGQHWGLAEAAAFLEVREAALAPVAGLVAAIVASGLGRVVLLERRPTPLSPPAG